MKKGFVSRDILIQLETLSKEAEFWVKKIDKDSPKIDLNLSMKKAWAKDRTVNKELFRFQPVP